MDTSHALSVLRETIPSAGMVVRAAEPADQTWTSRFQPDYWQTLSDIWGLSGESAPISTADALRISAVLICVDVLAQDVAKTKLRLMRRRRGGKEEVMPREHWLARMLALEPNRDFHTWYEFIEMTMLHLALVQNAFIVKKMRPDGQVTDLLPVMPGRVTIEVNENSTAYVYRVALGTQAELVQFGAQSLTLRPDEIIHLRGRMFDGLRGYSTLSAGASVMGLAREISGFQNRLYQNDGQMRGVFEKKDNAETEGLSDPAFDRLKKQLAEAMRRFRQEGRPIILEEGLTFKAVQMTADQAELAKAHEAAIEECCRLFRMPPHKAMHTKAVKYENLETLEKSYVSDTLIPYCERLEQRLERCLLTEDERLDYMLEFDKESLLLTDIEKRNSALKVGLSLGALEVDEWRLANGRNPLANGAGKVRLIPSTYALVDERNEILVPAGGAGGQAEAPTEDPASDEKNPAGSDKDLVGENVVPLRA